MDKKCLLFGICIIIVLSTISVSALGSTGVTENNIIENENAVVRKEAVLKISKALLGRHVLDIFSNPQIILDTEEKNGIKGRDIVVQKETALKIGRALLEEHFPDAFLKSEIILDAEEKNGIWRVYNVAQRQGNSENGETWILVGGEMYVEFSKNNGQVLKLGVDD